MRTLDAAQGHWRRILIDFGVDKTVLVNQHRTCPICSGKDRFRFDDKDGLGSWICNTCGAGYGYKLLQHVVDLPHKDLLARIDEILGHKSTPVTQKHNAEEDKRRQRLKLFGQQLRECGTITAAYLKNRGVSLSQMKYMREHPSAPYWHDGQLIGHFPAMVNALRDTHGVTMTYHITYVTNDGKKAEVPVAKKIMTPVKTITGSAIRLCGEYPDMAIAEGVETALGVMTYEGLPCWASYSANNLAKFDPPPWIKSLVIYGDRDRSFTGQAAAYELARRLSSRGIGVEVALPPDEGTDWLDYWGEVA